MLCAAQGIRLLGPSDPYAGFLFLMAFLVLSAVAIRVGAAAFRGLFGSGEDALKTVYGQIVRYLDPNAIFEPEEGIHWKRLEATGLMDTDWRIFGGKWRATLTLEGARAEVARFSYEVGAYDPPTCGSGLACLFRFPCRLPGRALVLPVRVRLPTQGLRPVLDLGDARSSRVWRLLGDDDQTARTIVGPGVASAFAEARFPSLRLSWHDYELALVAGEVDLRMHSAAVFISGSEAVLAFFEFLGLCATLVRDVRRSVPRDLC
ncbi:MAG: hypothetical protein HY720_03885 [Planctomycetes bacterium]|nr:hypothetical protein [Planctomycetota bacterium]